jgi:hypothetical protein
METNIQPSVSDEDLLGYADAWLKELYWIPEGSYKVNNGLFSLGKRKGWLAVDRDANGCTNIMWTTGRDTHQRLDGRAFSITVNPQGRLKYYFESAITMHIAWGQGRGNRDDLFRGLEAAWWMHGKLIHRQTPPTSQERAAPNLINRLFARLTKKQAVVE